MRSAVARPLDRLERAAEDVVVGDRDRAEPLRLARGRAARRRRSSSRATRSCACAGRRRSSRGPRAARAAAQPCGGGGRSTRRSPRRGRRAPRSSARAPRRAPRRRARAERLVLDQPRRLGGGELRLAARARRCGDRAPAACASSDDARQPVDAGTKIAAARRSSARARASSAVRTRHRPRSARGIGGRVAERASCGGARAPSPAAAASSRTSARSSGRSVWRHSSTTQLPLRRPARTGQVDTQRDELVVGRGTAPRRPPADLRRRREQRVEPAEQPLALRAAPAGSRAVRARRTSPTVSAPASRSAR